MKMGLGRGLDSLLKAYDNEVEEKQPQHTQSVSNYEMRQGDVEKIDINLVYPNPNQPRKTFDKESLNELAESIRIHGLIQPIIVNKMDASSIKQSKNYAIEFIFGLNNISCCACNACNNRFL